MIVCPKVKMTHILAAILKESWECAYSMFITPKQNGEDIFGLMIVLKNAREQTLNNSLHRKVLFLMCLFLDKGDCTVYVN